MNLTRLISALGRGAENCYSDLIDFILETILFILTDIEPDDSILSGADGYYYSYCYSIFVVFILLFIIGEGFLFYGKTIYNKYVFNSYYSTIQKMEIDIKYRINNLMLLILSLLF